MENLEGILEEIEKYDRNGYDEELSAALENYLRFIAKTGDPVFPWHRIRNLIRYKLSSVMGEFYNLYGGEEFIEASNTPTFSYTPTRSKILHHFDSFSGAPFTIQRICEILVDPMRHYKRTDKFLRAIEKNIFVVSVVEPGYTKRMAEHQLNMVNGLQESSMIHIPITATDIKERNHSSQSFPEENGCLSEEPLNGNLSSDGVADDSSSSSSSSSSSTSSSPTPDDDPHELGPAPKRPRHEAPSDEIDDSCPRVSSGGDEDKDDGDSKEEERVDGSSGESEEAKMEEGRVSEEAKMEEERVSEEAKMEEGRVDEECLLPKNSEDDSSEVAEEVGTSDEQTRKELHPSDENVASPTSEVDSSINEDGEGDWNHEETNASSNIISPDSAQDSADAVVSGDDAYNTQVSLSEDSEANTDESLQNDSEAHTEESPSSETIFSRPEEQEEADSTSSQATSETLPSGGKEASPLRSHSAPAESPAGAQDITTSRREEEEASSLDSS